MLTPSQLMGSRPGPKPRSLSRPPENPPQIESRPIPAPVYRPTRPAGIYRQLMKSHDRMGTRHLG